MIDLTKPARRRDILATVAKFYGIPQGHILSRGRGPARQSEARHAFVGLTRDFTGHSLPAIGRYLGRDHTTMVNSEKRCWELCQSRPDFAAKYQQAHAALYAAHMKANACNINAAPKAA